jgi:hypothetical protein
MDNDITIVYIAIVTLNNNECCDIICRLLLLLPINGNDRWQCDVTLTHYDPLIMTEGHSSDGRFSDTI